MPLTTDWSKLGGLFFEARRLVEGLHAGAHPSSRLGAGIEFHDYRPYVSGDDVAAIDWKLYGRTDRHFIKRRRRLSDLQATLLVDVSASMDFAGFDARGRPLVGPEHPTKLAFARRLAAAIAFLIIRQNDRAALATFAAGIEHWHAPTGAWAGLQRLCATLEQAQPQPGRGDLAASLRQAHAMMKRRGLIVVISDLLDEPAGLLDGVSRFRHDHFDVAVLQLLTPVELDLGRAGDLRLKLVNPESREQVGTSLHQVRQRYGRLIDEHIATLRRGCLALGADYQLFTTDRSPVDALRTFLSTRRV